MEENITDKYTQFIWKLEMEDLACICCCLWKAFFRLISLSMKISVKYLATNRMHY